ncbi:MAG: hypothetical protein R2839_06230 [Thermomicrobiales bacterium]
MDQRDVAPPPMPVVIAINKCDLPVRKEQTLLTSALPEAAVVAISSKTGDGLPALEESVAAALTGGQRAQPSLISVRQRAALERALAHLQEALTTRTAGFPLDLLATDVRAALHAIGEVTGENVDEAVLTEIFSRFCIGSNSGQRPHAQQLSSIRSRAMRTERGHTMTFCRREFSSPGLFSKCVKLARSRRFCPERRASCPRSKLSSRVVICSGWAAPSQIRTVLKPPDSMLATLGSSTTSG